MSKEEKIKEIRNKINSLNRELYKLDEETSNKKRAYNREYNKTHKEQIRRNYLNYIARQKAKKNNNSMEV